MKKVLIFSLAYHPFAGGAEIALKEITDRIDPEDIEFHLITNRYDSTLPAREKIGNILVHRIGFARPNPSREDLQTLPFRLSKLVFQFAAFWKARELHREYRYDGIWAMMAHSAGVPAALFKTLFPNVPYILTLQEGDPLPNIERQMRVFGPLFTRAFRKADVLQSISTFLGVWGKRMGFQGVPVVIPNGVDVLRFSNPRTSYTEKIGKKEGDVFLVTASRLVHKNAIDDVIRALPYLPDHVHFLVLGDGPDEAPLKALAEKCEVASRTHFLGKVAYDELPEYLAACDIFIRPSRSEGMGNAFIEAMAARLPVIGTQVGGIVDFLFDRVRNPEMETTGWAVDPDSPPQIVQAVEDILSHPEEVERVVRHAHTLIASRYDWKQIAHEMRTKVFSKIST